MADENNMNNAAVEEKVVGDYHPGALAHPHEQQLDIERNGFRGGGGGGGAKMIHEPSEEGETAIIECGTTQGPFIAKMHRDWAPNGYDRVVALYQKGFYDHSHFFRVVPHFIVQFGISYTTDKSLLQFANTPIPDDPNPEPRKQFTKGTMAFAGSGPNSRTSQMFISYGDNPGLGKEPWEVPFGEVIEGMEHVEAFYSYGDMPPWGKGPEQQKIRNDPNYIKDQFPLLDKFETCQVKINKPSQNTMTEDVNHQVEEMSQQHPEDELGVKEPIDDVKKHRNVLEEEATNFKGKDALSGDDSQHNEAEAIAQEALGPFTDILQVGAVIAVIIILVLLCATLSRRKGKKKHKH